MRNGMFSSTHPFRLRWRLGIFAALAITLLSLVPQLSFWRARGGQWQGSFYSYHPDEYPYRRGLTYERDQGEHVGEFILYGVKPRIKN